jgi:hypothetical protein
MRLLFGCTDDFEWLCKQDIDRRRYWAYPFVQQKVDKSITSENVILELSSDLEKFHANDVRNFLGLTGFVPGRMTKNTSNYTVEESVRCSAITEMYSS